jgi:hypothetical protein
MTETAMATLNIVLARLADLLLYPLEDRSPLVGLTIVSLASAIVIVAFVHATSDRTRLADVKRAHRASFLEIRLFNGDLRAMARALGEMLRHDVTQLRLSLVPALWMVVPLGLGVAQLQFRYGYSGLEIGRPTLVEVRVNKPLIGASSRETDEGRPALVLTAPPGIRVETPAVWIPSLRESAWRIVAEQPGDYELVVQAGGELFTKTVRVTSGIVRLSPIRTDGGLVNQLLSPAEPPLPEGAPIESIAVTYPRREILVLGREVHWMIVFISLSTVFTIVGTSWTSKWFMPAPAPSVAGADPTRAGRLLPR